MHDKTVTGRLSHGCMMISVCSLSLNIETLIRIRVSSSSAEVFRIEQMPECVRA